MAAIGVKPKSTHTLITSEPMSGRKGHIRDNPGDIPIDLRDRTGSATPESVKKAKNRSARKAKKRQRQRGG
jgi:hypothetical protein